MQGRFGPQPEPPVEQQRDTVSAGIVGRSTTVAVATTRMKLLSNNPKPGLSFCNPCDEFCG